MNNRKSIVVSGRIPPELRNKMIKQDLTVKEAVEIAIYVKSNPHLEYESELKMLFSRNERLSNEIVRNNQRIEELKELLGYEGDNNSLKQDLFSTDNDKAIQKTLDRYFSWRGDSGATIYNFIESKVGKTYIEQQLTKCDLSEDEFCLELINKCDESKQTTLD